MAALSAATASAQPARTGSVAEIAYRAPASCPGRSTFEQRLRQRLRTGPNARLPATLSIALSLDARKAVGEITVTSGPRSGARRRVTAASCDEAVDALTLVTALLIEPEARGEVAPEAQRAPASNVPRAPSASRARTSSGGSGEARSGGATPGASADSSSAQDEPPPRTAGAPDRDSMGRASAGAADGEAASEAANETASEPPPKRASAPEATKTRARVAQPEAAEPRAATPAGAGRGLQIELAIAALLAVGTLPSPRPGLLGRVSLALPLARAWALALELGGRGLLPQRERSPEGDARFQFYAGGVGLCARTGRGSLAASLCAQGELGQLAADGEKTSNPRRARALWSAVGPGARAALQLSGPLALHAGMELLFPTSRDRFQVGARDLFVVPRLTFRMELGLGVHFE